MIKELWIKIVTVDGKIYEGKISTRELNEIMECYIEFNGKFISFGSYKELKYKIISIKTFFKEVRQN